MDFDLSRIVRAQTKALGPHPAFMGSDPVSVYSPGAARTDAKLTKRMALQHQQAYGGDEAIDWVYSAIGLYSEPTGAAPYRLERDDGTKLVRIKTDGDPPDHEVGPAALYDVLDRPNPYMLYDEFIALLVIDLLLTGDGYWLKFRSNEQGQPLSLYRLAPGFVKIIPDSFGPKRYEYQPPGAKDPMKLDASEVIHFRRPNPHDAFYGMGVIQGTSMAMDLELAVTDTMVNYYGNRADPSIIFQSERRVPRDVFKKLSAQLLGRVMGPKRSGAPLLLEAGLTATSLSPSASDMLFAVLATMSRDRVLSKFHVAPMLLGITDQNSGSNKVSDFRRDFDNYTLRPFMDRLQNLITEGLARAYGVKYIIDHSYQSPPDEQIKVAQQVAATPGVKVREVRKMLSQFGIEESTGDENIDNFVLNMPGPEMDENGQVRDPVTGEVLSQPPAADRPLAGEAGRPPKGENTKGFGVAKPAKKTAGKKALDDVDRRAQLLVDRLLIEGKALTNPDGSNATIGNTLQGEIPPDPTARFRASNINASMLIMQEALADAAVTLERGLLDHVEGKAFKTADLVGRIRKSTSWKTFQDMVDAALMEGARNAISSSVMDQASQGRIPDDDLDYDVIAASVVRRPEGVRSIVKTLKDRVAMRVKRAIDKDEALESVVQSEVQLVMRDWATNQVTLIADSEATEAYNEATLTVAEFTGSDLVYVIEEDDAPDEACQQARGQVWDISTARAHRKEHPRCRRAFLPLEAGAVA